MGFSKTLRETSVSVLMFGANPGVTLFDVHGQSIAFASVWRIDWSVNGAGSAVVAWLPGEVRIVTGQPELGTWLAGAFNRHFPEVQGLPWSAPRLTVAPVTIALDHTSGLHAEADDITVDITGPMDRRTATVEAFPGNNYRLSNVYVPFRIGRVSVDGKPVDGNPAVTETPRASSTAFLADAEVWSTS
jgi:hypothetical protein